MLTDNKKVIIFIFINLLYLFLDEYRKYMIGKKSILLDIKLVQWTRNENLGNLALKCTNVH